MQIKRILKNWSKGRFLAIASGNKKHLCLLQPLELHILILKYNKNVVTVVGVRVRGKMGRTSALITENWKFQIVYNI